jgi:hypothetical protein
MALADLVVILAKHEVEFIIVGGMAAVLRGTPVNTFDLDVVYGRSPTNVERLLQALDELQAVVRDDSRRLRLKRVAPSEPRAQADGNEPGTTRSSCHD